MMKRILFACIKNSGRSQMAAGWLNALADPAKGEAISAGTDPAARVQPEAAAAMGEVGVALSGAVPRLLTDELARTCDLLVTMGCGEACPAVPGLRREDWPLADPKGRTLERVREIRDEIRRRVEELVAREGLGSSR
jgi:arsenate reductase